MTTADLKGNRDAGLEEMPLDKHPPHPLAELFPPMTSADFDALVADIRQNGLLDPIVLYDDQVLDGRHRYNACQQLGIEPATIEFSGPDPVAFIIAKNLRRRDLTSAQKRQVIARLLKFAPEKSNRQIAADVGVDDKTVGTVRSALEDGAEIPHHAARVGKDGVVQPARKKAKPKAPEPKAHFSDDPDFQAEAEAATRDLEIERDERIALSGGTELAAENEHLNKQVRQLDRRINAMINENGSLKYRARMWEKRARALGWKDRASA